jgi:hypothetical protein
MNVGTLSPQQLRSLVEDKWQRDEEALAVGLHVTSVWRGPAEVELEFGKARVVHADTVFQAREELLAAEQSKGRIVLLTKLQQSDLGHDVIARLARCRLFTVDHWATLSGLFKAKELDRSICDVAIAQALLDHRPADGYPPVSAGVLDAGTAWRAICRHVFDMGEREPDLVSLLLWATTKSGVARYSGATDELKASLRLRLIANLGEAADSVLRFVENGAGGDAVALGIVCQVVFGNGQDPTLDAAAARMEQYHNNKPIQKWIGGALSRAAAEAIGDLDRKEDPRPAQQHLERADDLLRQFRCDDHAYRNRMTRSGYEQRLGRFGDQIVAAVETPSEESLSLCEVRQSEIADHRLAKLGRRTDQVSRTEMAVRLVRWLSHPHPCPDTFPELAKCYQRELSFVDWARESICRGEEVGALTRAYQKLDQAVLSRREGFNQAFAKALANWTSVGSKFLGINGVEDVLSNIVAKIVESNNRVLLIVLDGMSWAVCHELLTDIRQEHWFEGTLDESSVIPSPVIATVPSVTQYSRATLLSGVLTKGDAAVEKRNFETNPALRQVCDKKYPPVLFHKKEVTEGSRGVVSDDLSKAVLSLNNRVVGVVINAIDDRLNGAQQIRDNWSIDRIGPLARLLTLARDSGRVVVLAADHGHVWHRPDARLLDSEVSTRWRPKSDELHEGEISISGERVRDEAGLNAIIVPWTETIYYKRQQNGYHGGATPQEMICPLIILADTNLADERKPYPGLYPCEYLRPEWWSSAPAASVVALEPAPVAVPIRTGPPSLFDKLLEEDPPSREPTKAVEPIRRTATTASGWIERLLSSQGYRDQKDFVRRHAPEDELVQRCLAALDAQGGMMTPAAFAKAADVAAGRLDGLIARIQRLLNVDGYEILTLSRAENRIELNVAKLKRQFDLD